MTLAPSASVTAPPASRAQDEARLVGVIPQGAGDVASAKSSGSNPGAGWSRSRSELASRDSDSQ